MRWLPYLIIKIAVPFSSNAASQMLPDSGKNFIRKLFFLIEGKYNSTKGIKDWSSYVLFAHHKQNTFHFLRWQRESTTVIVLLRCFVEFDSGLYHSVCHFGSTFYSEWRNRFKALQVFSGTEEEYKPEIFNEKVENRRKTQNFQVLSYIPALFCSTAKYHPS